MLWAANEQRNWLQTQRAFASSAHLVPTRLSFTKMTKRSPSAKPRWFCLTRKTICSSSAQVLLFTRLWKPPDSWKRPELKLPCWIHLPSSLLIKKHWFARLIDAKAVFWPLKIITPKVFPHLFTFPLFFTEVTFFSRWIGWSCGFCFSWWEKCCDQAFGCAGGTSFRTTGGAVGQIWN